MNTVHFWRAIAVNGNRSQQLRENYGSTVIADSFNFSINNSSG